MRRSMMRLALSMGLAAFAAAGSALGGEPPTGMYWDVKDVRPGMKGVGRTVMVGTKLEEFEAEVLGVLRGVSPGRDMILCRLKGCNLEHAGIIQGMSGSPIYVEGKLLGAVAYAWEFAKDPIAGVTPFGQMVEYVKASDRRLAAEAADRALARTGAVWKAPALFDLAGVEGVSGGLLKDPAAANGSGVRGMQPISVPLAAAGFSPRAISALGRELAPLGMAPAAAGGVYEEILAREGSKPLAPGSPMCVAMVMGDFDLSAIGTVTHVEGDRVYGFGHPMFGLGVCELPLMTGYIHTVYPRASVSMKMGSPLKVVGILDTDVSTGVSGRIGPQPDMMPMTVKVRTGRYSEPREYHVQIARHPKMMSSLVQSVLTSAIDTEGDLPDELTARLHTRIDLEGQDPIELNDLVSGPRFSGALGPTALFGPISTLVGVLTRNAIQPQRISRIECEIVIEAGRATAELSSLRLASERVAPGEAIELHATVRPFQAEARDVTMSLTLPTDLPEGSYEVVLCDASQSLRRRSSSNPHLSEARTTEAMIAYLRLQTELRRSSLFAHIQRPERGLAVEGQALAGLPDSMRAVLADSRQTTPAGIRSDLIAAQDTPWMIEGSQSLKFQVRRETE